MSTNQQATQQQVNVLYQAMAPLGNRGAGRRQTGAAHYH